MPSPLLHSTARFSVLAAAVGLVGVLAVQASCSHLQSVNASGGGSSSPTDQDAESCPAAASTSTFTEISTDTVIDLDSGLPEAGEAGACGDSGEQLSHTRGVGLDITQAVGYTPDAAIPAQATALLPSGNAGALANQMRGNSVGGTPQFNDIYRTPDDPNTGIRGILFRDGPRGVNLESPVYTGAQVQGGQLNYGPGYATVFPVSMARGATWDLDLEAQIGRDLADEVLASGNNLTIAPAVNLLRHPAWGRAQEMYGEDSFAVGRMGSAYVDGAQEYIPACVKHLAAYNIEQSRFYQTAVMDSQTLHEVFGRHFEMIVQESGVACVMASYNSIQLTDGNDTATYKDTSNPVLLNGMLRTTFGFKGFIMSDFWAMPNNQNTGLQYADYQSAASAAIAAGLDMEMPWAMNFANIETLPNAVQTLQPSAMRIVEQKLRFNIASTSVTPGGLKPPTTNFTTNGIQCNGAHLQDAEHQAEEAMVLLKNDNNTLPIVRSAVKKVAVIGAVVPFSLPDIGVSGNVNFATDPRIGDLGSSRVALDPSRSVGPFAGIQAAAGSGITVTSGSDPSLADSADFAVVVVGLTPEDEGEEYTGAADRVDPTSGKPNLSLDPKSSNKQQDALVAAVAAKGKPMVVVVEAGSGINMPWLSSVPAVVMAWYPGQLGGTALGKLLFGDVNFTGKLPITWPKSEDDEPAFNTGGDKGGTTMMGYYLGYRYFDYNKTTPLFAFGSGLSYSSFKYQFLGVPCTTVTQNSVVDVQVAVTNTGTVAGNDVAFLFVSYPQTGVRRSFKELKGFHRTSQIPPGKTVIFTIPLRVQDLKYWNTAANSWAWESGPVNIKVGPSSDNLPLTGQITVQ